MFWKIIIPIFVSRYDLNNEIVKRRIYVRYNGFISDRQLSACFEEIGF